MTLLDVPRTINPASTFDALVQWFYDEVVIARQAPGLLIGLSGTDSLVTFLAAYEAFARAGKPSRVWGVHFAPSDDFLYDHPEAQVHLWFSKEIIPWLREKTKGAPITVDTSIDWRCDGLRWGAMADMSVVSNDHRRAIRLPEDQYWVVGTRNRSENTLLTYSNASMLASLQPLIHLWKSEILQISEYLGVPKLAISKSCETDCICGRERLPASHPQELDLLLMLHVGELNEKYVKGNVSEDLRRQLGAYIGSQIGKGCFKNRIPYQPDQSVVRRSYLKDPLVLGFENGSLNLKEFNHRQHLYVAWCYLKSLSLETSVERYMRYLRVLLESAGQSFRFSADVTRAYFQRLDEIMKRYPTDSFEELAFKYPQILTKISA